MKISEYRHIARKNLKGCYCEAFIVTALCLFVYLSFKAAELLMAYFWSGYAGSLISGLLKAAVTALCFFADNAVSYRRFLVVFSDGVRRG